MSKLSIIYHVYTNCVNLENSLNSIIKMNNLDDIELILIDDNAFEREYNIVKNSKIKNLKNFKYVICSQNLGHSYSYNLGTKIATSDYIFFAGSEIEFKSNFIIELTKIIDKFEQPDVVMFSENNFRYFKLNDKNNISNTQLFINLDPNLIYINDWTLGNKIFKKNFLINNKCEMTEFRNYSILFTLNTLAKSNKIVYLNETLTKYVINLKPSFNLYDLIFQTNEFSNLIKKYNWNSKEYKNALGFLTIKTILYDFVYFVLNSEMTTEEKKVTINKAYKFLHKDWNKSYSSINECTKSIIETKWKNYFNKFKPKLSWVEKEFNTK